MHNIIFYSVTLTLVFFSFHKDRNKTKKAIAKAWKAFENIIPQFMGIIILTGITLAVVNPDVINSVIGKSSGWAGVAFASLAGAVTLIPGFIAFPTAAMLIQGGAGYMQIGAFVSSLMMVGVVTLPLEIKIFGRKSAYSRNTLAFIFSFIAAFFIGMTAGEL